MKRHHHVTNVLINKMGNKSRCSDEELLVIAEVSRLPLRNQALAKKFTNFGQFRVDNGNESGVDVAEIG